MASLQVDNVSQIPGVKYKLTNVSQRMNNSNDTDTTNTEMSIELLTVIQITCYSVIIVIGSIGNLILLINNLALKRSRKISQYFINF